MTDFRHRLLAPLFRGSVIEREVVVERALRLALLLVVSGIDVFLVPVHGGEPRPRPSVRTAARSFTPTTTSCGRSTCPTGSPEELTVDLSFDPTTNFVEWVHAENRADSMIPSPTGDFLAVDFRGEVFIVPVNEGIGEKTQVNPRTAFEPCWEPVLDGPYFPFCQLTSSYPKTRFQPARSRVPSLTPPPLLP